MSCKAIYICCPFTYKCWSFLGVFNCSIALPIKRTSVHIFSWGHSFKKENEVLWMHRVFLWKLWPERDNCTYAGAIESFDSFSNSILFWCCSGIDACILFLSIASIPFWPGRNVLLYSKWRLGGASSSLFSKLVYQWNSSFLEQNQ